MALGIDPTVDFAFKLVFGNPAHTRVTIHFLNAVLQWPDPITWVEILNPIHGQERPDDKLVVLDVLAQDRAGRRFNIEMQTTIAANLRQRLTYYNCLNYTRQLLQGDDYGGLQPAVSICVIDGVMFPMVGDYHLSFQLRCEQHSLVLNSDLMFHTLELPKYDAKVDNDIQCGSELEQWMFFLRNAPSLDARELVTRLVAPEFREAVGVLEMITNNPDDEQFYEERRRFLRSEEVLVFESKREGREQGMLVGQIQTLQQVLGLEEESAATLLARTTEDLEATRDALQQQLQRRGESL